MPALSKEDVSAAAVGPAFEFDFQSRLPGEDELANVAADPLHHELTSRQGEPLLAEDMQRDSVALAQAVQTISVNRGLAGFQSLGDEPFATIVRAVGQTAYDADRRIGALVNDGVVSLMDTSMTSLGSVPFIGLAAQVIYAAVRFVYDYAGPGYSERRPPLYQMSPHKDTQETRRALGLLRDSDDWTGLFLPRTKAVLPLPGQGALPGGGNDPKNPNLGGWGEESRDGGMEFQRPLVGDGVERFGCAPGSLTYVDDGVQSRVTPGECTLPSKRKPRYIDALNAGKNLQAALDLVFPRGEWLPSLSALARAVWANVGQAQSAAMFSVDAKAVEREWQAFEDSCVEWREFLRSVHGESYDARLPDLGKSARRAHIATFLSRVAAAHHDRLGVTDVNTLLVTITGRAPHRGATVGKRAVGHAQTLNTRQRAAIETPMNALVSKNAPGLRNRPVLREKFLRERAKLLSAGQFDALALHEVRDQDLRRRMADRRPGGQRFAVQEARGWTVPPPDPFDDETPVETSGGGGGLLLAAGAVGLVGLLGAAITRR